MARAFGILLVVGMCIVAYGAGRGWFRPPSGDVQRPSSYEMGVDHDQIRRDRDEFVGRARARLEELDLRLREMQARADRETGQARQDLDVAIAEQRRDLEAARRRLDDWRVATAEQWQDAKVRASQALDDLKRGFEDAFSRFQ